MSMTFERERELDRFVHNEVRANVTGLMAHLAELYGDNMYFKGEEEIPCVQYDWQTPAEEAGWRMHSLGRIHRWTEALGDEEVSTWQEACEACEEYIEPHEREIFQWYAVSSFLADDLEEEGEVVLRDFHGLDLWGRTTFGQAISMDYVIQKVYDNLQKGVTNASGN